jgi:hypothetical protein
VKSPAANIALPLFGQNQHSYDYFISNGHLLLFGVDQPLFPNSGNAKLSGQFSPDEKICIN